jgi:hypothetical protein
MPKARSSGVTPARISEGLPDPEQPSTLTNCVWVHRQPARGLRGGRRARRRRWWRWRGVRGSGRVIDTACGRADAARNGIVGAPTGVVKAHAPPNATGRAAGSTARWTPPGRRPRPRPARCAACPPVPPAAILQRSVNQTA